MRTGDDNSDITTAACLTATRDRSEDNLQFLRMLSNIKYRTDGVHSTPWCGFWLRTMVINSTAETSPRETKLPLINELHCCEEHREAWVLSATALGEQWLWEQNDTT